GFSLAPAVGEPPDHAAVELEFMSLLCGREVEAWIREDLTESAESLEREKHFLAQHLSRWFPEFTRRVANRNGSGFYALAADAAQAFIAHDLDLVSVLLGRFQEVAEG
ncbi:MAG: molecular chaperone TorD family protein, partial [bacterium]